MITKQPENAKAGAVRERAKHQIDVSVLHLKGPRLEGNRDRKTSATLPVVLERQVDSISLKRLDKHEFVLPAGGLPVVTQLTVDPCGVGFPTHAAFNPHLAVADMPERESPV